jgi:acetyl esterase/lipase
MLGAGRGGCQVGGTRGLRGRSEYSAVEEFTALKMTSIGGILWMSPSVSEAEILKGLSACPSERGHPEYSAAKNSLETRNANPRRSILNVPWTHMLKPISRHLVILILFIVAPCLRAAEAPADVEFTRDVVYGKAGDVELKLNIARPKDAKAPLPLVLFIHGGGWVAGDRSGHDAQTWDFAKRGYVAATVGYRLTDVAKWPAQVNDVKCAVRFLRANATKYGIDPDHIGAVGFSAGAHLAMMLAVADKNDNLEGTGGSPEQSSAIHAAVSFFGPTDLARDDLPPAGHPLVEKLVGHLPEKGNKACESASPLYYVSKGDAPMLLFQGTADPLVPPTQATVMAEAMAKAQIPGRVELIMNAGHGWNGPELTRTIDATTAFLDKWLKHPAK